LGIGLAFLDGHITTFVLVHQSLKLAILRQQLGLFLLQLVYVFGSLLKYRGLQHESEKYSFREFPEFVYEFVHGIDRKIRSPRSSQFQVKPPCETLERGPAEIGGASLA